MRNVVGPPVRGEDYFARPKVTKMIWRALDNGNNVLIQAPRRSGVTSLLLDLCDDSKEKLISVYIDVSSIQDENELYERIVKKLHFSLKTSLSQYAYLAPSPDFLKKFEAFLPEQTKLDNLRKKELFTKALELLTFLPKELQVLIVIDELAQALVNINSSNGLGEVNHLLQVLRDARMSALNCRFIFSIESSESLSSLNPYDSVLMNDLVPVQLLRLTYTELLSLFVSLLAKSEFTVQEQTLEYVLQKANLFYPYHVQLLVQIIIDLAFDHEISVITEAIVDLAIERFNDSGALKSTDTPKDKKTTTQDLPKVQIAKLAIESVKCIDNIELEFECKSNISLLLGPNARGKTTVLQLLALGLTGIEHVPFPYSWRHVVRNGQNAGHFVLDININEQLYQLSFEIDAKDSIKCVGGVEHLAKIKSNMLLLAYGANRHIKLEDLRPHPGIESIATLFGENGYLKHIKASESYQYVSENFTAIKRLVNAVLEKADLQNTILLSDFDTKSLYFESATSGKMPIEALSEGFKSTFVWLFDMILRIVETAGNLQSTNHIPGIVLLDEVDLHLHPSWQRTILPALEDTFPNVQFIVTSHSPFVAQSIKADKLISLEWEDEQVKVVYKDTSTERSYGGMVREVFGIRSQFSERTAKDLTTFKGLQADIRKGNQYDEQSFKELVIDIAGRGAELEEVMRNEIYNLERKTGRKFDLWKN